jgi:hypothetical protein
MPPILSVLIPSCVPHDKFSVNAQGRDCETSDRGGARIVNQPLKTVNEVLLFLQAGRLTRPQVRVFQQPASRKGRIMSLMDAYKEKLQAQIQEQKARLDLLKARAKRVAAQGTILGYEELAQADKQLAQVKAKLVQLKGAGGVAFEDIKAGVKKALEDLKVSTQKAAGHFTEPPPKPKARTRRKPAAAAKAVRTAKRTKARRR